MLKGRGKKLLSTYSRPKTKDGFFAKHEYIYDEYYDCYICPDNQILSYSTTNRVGYREYKSCGSICAGCPYLAQCTHSKNHVKTVTRHMWAVELEEAEENRYTCGIQGYYKMQTIERDFALTIELHGFRYTQEYGQARIEWKAALTYAYINLKKLAKKRWKEGKKLYAPLDFKLYLSYSSRFRRKNVLSLNPQAAFAYSLNHK